ncbi:MAG: hypothetical protein LBI62_00880 [Candidatus Accumulibacter sp.]|jgi:hypothetical protein|nr:hypothetical protein [Accumulibacter sp.]
MNFDFDVLAAFSPAPRGEFLNIGIVVWRDGLPEIHSDFSDARLSAVDGNYPRLSVFRSLKAGSLNSDLRLLLEPLRDTPDALRMLFDSLISPMRRHGSGRIFCNDDDHDKRVEELLNRLVRKSVPVVRLERAKRTSSRLDSEIRGWLRKAKVMGRSMEDLSKNRVVAQYPISEESDICADFAYKNGALNVIETLDLRGVEHMTNTWRNFAAFKSITLDMAKDIPGIGNRIGVVVASDYSAIRSALRLFQRNSDQLFSLDDPGDSQRFADLLASGLHLDEGLMPVDLSKRTEAPI